MRHRWSGHVRNAKLLRTLTRPSLLLCRTGAHLASYVRPDEVAGGERVTPYFCYLLVSI